jgi:hypothetical protein
LDLIALSRSKQVEVGLGDGVIQVVQQGLLPCGEQVVQLVVEALEHIGRGEHLAVLVGGSEIAVRADRARRQVGLDEGGTALELVEVVLEAGELAGRHQGDPGQRLQGDETRVFAQGGLGLVLGDAEPGLRMAGHVGRDIVLLEL